MSYASPKGVNYNKKMEIMASSIANFQNAMTSSIETFTKKKQAQQAEADKKILRDEKAYGKFNEDFLAAKQVASTLASGIKDKEDKNSLQSQIDNQLSFIGANLKTTLDGLGPDASNQQVLNATNDAILKMRQLKGDMGHLLTAFNDYKEAIQYGAEEGGALVLGNGKNADLINMFASWEDGKQNVVISSQPGDPTFQISLLSDKVKRDSSGNPIAPTGQYGTTGKYDFEIEESFNLSDWSTKVAKSGEYFDTVPDEKIISGAIADGAKRLEKLVNSQVLGKPDPNGRKDTKGNPIDMILDPKKLAAFQANGMNDNRYANITDLIPGEDEAIFQSMGNNTVNSNQQIPKIDPVTKQPELDNKGNIIMITSPTTLMTRDKFDAKTYRAQVLDKIVAQYNML